MVITRKMFRNASYGVTKKYTEFEIGQFKITFPNKIHQDFENKEIFTYEERDWRIELGFIVPEDRPAKYVVWINGQFADELPGHDVYEIDE